MGAMKDNQIGIFDRFSNGITEEEFIEMFEEVQHIYTSSYPVFSYSTGKLEDRVETDSMFSILDDIYMSNPEKNKWCLVENMSETMKLFLKLNGEPYGEKK
jgi:hypothetical protein